MSLLGNPNRDGFKLAEAIDDVVCSLSASHASDPDGQNDSGSNDAANQTTNRALLALLLADCAQNDCDDSQDQTDGGADEQTHDQRQNATYQRSNTHKSSPFKF